MIGGYFAADSRRWPTVAAMLVASGQPWERDAIVIDLQWWADQMSLHHKTGGRDGCAKPPGRRDLCKRWRVSDWQARSMLVDEPAWQRWVDLPAAESPPSGLPRSSQRPPSGLPPVNGGKPETVQEPPASLPGSSRVPPADLHTRGNCTDHPAPTPAPDTQPADAVSPPAEPEAAPVKPSSPKWAVSAAKPSPAKPADLYEAVLSVVAVVRNKPREAVEAAGFVTDAKTLTAFWKAQEWPPLDSFAADASLVAHAFRECPDPLFARDVRAEGWAGGVDRRADVGTLCVQQRWSVRLATAREWDRNGRPTSAPPNATPDPRSRGRPTGDDLNAQALAILRAKYQPAP